MRRPGARRNTPRIFFCAAADKLNFRAPRRSTHFANAPSAPSLSARGKRHRNPRLRLRTPSTNSAAWPSLLSTSVGARARSGTPNSRHNANAVFSRTSARRWRPITPSPPDGNDVRSRCIKRCGAKRAHTNARNRASSVAAVLPYLVNLWLHQHLTPRASLSPTTQSHRA